MDNTFIFTIENLRTVNVANYENYVIDITYKVSKSDSGVVGYHLGIVKFELPTNETIVPFNELTEETVIGWVKSSLKEMETEMIESSISSMIERLKNPAPAPQMAPLPWAN